MSIKDVTREAVLEAIAEYDRLGEAEFLRRYGFRKSRTHFVRFNGKTYASKAVLGIGQNYSGVRNRTSQKPAKFYGGRPTTGRLTQLGFEVFSLNTEGAAAYDEGKRYFSETSSFIRNSKLVREAKLHHGTVCQACEFDFEAVYGSLGSGFIECHHLNPLAEQDGSNQKTTFKDVAVLCANCHRMIHRDKSVRTVEDLRAAMKKAKRG